MTHKNLQKPAVKNLLEDRYFTKGETSWEELTDRVVKGIMSVETNLDEEDEEYFSDNFKRMMNDLDFIPNSPMLMNMGTELGYLSACNVLSVEDDMEDIFETLKEMALINKAGGGTGYAFSRLRPKGDKVGKTGRYSSGALSFMRAYDEATYTIKQGGKRRGANMGVLRIDHPDIFDFIQSKGELDERHEEIYEYIDDLVDMTDEQKEKIKQKFLDNQLSNFNISVGVTDKFMKCLEKGKNFPLVNPRTGEETEKVDPKEIWDLIVDYAYKNGEPGLVFLDVINETHPAPERIESVNVCGEQPLLPYESCILGAINLGNMVKDGEIDWDKLEDTIYFATRFLDNAIDANNYPVDKLEKSAKKYRKIGVGVMGWAEMLIKLGMRYGSNASLDLAEKMSKFINDTAIKTSEVLADEKGAFEAIDNTDLERPRRNLVTTTVAPTGSRSFIAGTSGGIEPFYDINGYTHTDGDGNVTGFTFDFMEEADEYELVGALDIHPTDHVYMQSAWQKHIGSAVSKTVNLSNDATKEDVKRIYELAYKTGCKGITVYRDGSKTTQVLSSTNKEEEKQEVTELKRGEIKEVGEIADSKRFKLNTGCGTLYFIPVFDNQGNLVELFNSTSNGGCKATVEAMSRLISLALRGGIKLEDVIDQLNSIHPCSAYMYAKGKGENLNKGNSCPSAIANVLKEFIKDEQENDSEKKVNSNIEMKDLRTKIKEHNDSDKEHCPECGVEIIRESGCLVCNSCGWSKCG